MKVLHKRSEELNKLPSTDNLEYGEIAINYAKGSEGIYFKNKDNNIISIRPVKQDVGDESTAGISQRKFTYELNKLKEEVNTKTVKSSNGVYINDNNAIYEGSDNNLNITAHKDVVLNATSGDMSSFTKLKVQEDGISFSEFKSRTDKELFKLQTSQNNVSLKTDKNIVLDGKTTYTKSSMYVGGDPEQDKIDGNYKFCVGGDACVYGNLEQASDENLKHILGEVELKVEDIAKVRAVRYKWKDNNVKTHVGTIAQDWEKILPESTYKNDYNVMTLDCEGALMCAVISLSKEVLNQRETIKELKEEINKIKENGNHS